MLTFNADDKQNKQKTKKSKKIKAKKTRLINYEKLIGTLSRFKPKYLNLGILLSVLGLAAFGLIMIYSASSYNAVVYYNNPYHFFTSQLIGFILGIVALTVAYKIDYRTYGRYYWWILGLGIFVLLLVFVPGIGVSKLGAQRWIGLGGFTMQSSEIAKFCFVVFAAALLAKNDYTASKFKTVLTVIAAGGILCALILAEPNLSITLCLGLTIFCMLFLCGARMRHLVLLAAPMLVLVPALLIAEPYRIRRLVAFVDPWATPKAEGFQLIQSLFSLGNGGLFGVGFGNSTQKYMFLPFSESDFIFSIIGEEFGLLGCLVFIAVLGFLIYSIFRTGIQSRDKFGKFLCYGIGTLIFLQSFINLAVVTGSIPPTGLPLPFISFGGTSLAVFLGAVGVVLNVDKQNRLQRKDNTGD